MTLTKTDITESIRTQTGYTRRRATALLESTLEIMKDRLSSGEDVLISGFGKFSVRDKGRRKGRNPVIGNDIELEARRVVVFRCSQVLKEKLNGKG